MSDREILRDLMQSVYVTPRQREALGRILGLPKAARSEDGVKASKRASDEDEAKRHALLGPCGAE